MPTSASSWSPGYTEPIFNRSTFDLRDKTLLAFDRDKVDRIIASSAGETSLELAKDGTDWKMTKPIAALADYSAVDALARPAADGRR